MDYKTKRTTYFMKKILLYLSSIVIFSALFTSCGGNENDDDLIGEGITSSIIVSANKFNIVLTEESEQESFVFTASSNNGVNITEFCTFYINEVELESNTFLPEELGTYQVTAKYEDIESNIVTINIVDITSTYFKHKVLIEDFTGTWCGWCTRIMYAIELVESQTHNTVPVAIHNNDEFDYSGRMPLETFLQIEGAYPFASLNRTTIWMPLQHQRIDQPISMIQPMSPIGIKINSNLGNNSGTVDVSFSFKEDIAGELRYVIYILENGLTANQKNYYNNLYGGDVTLHNFVHNHVLIGVHGNILGNNLEQSAIENSEVTLSNLAVNYSSQNVNNLQVVAFLIDAQGAVLNVQIANGNTEKDYEMAN